MPVHIKGMRYADSFTHGRQAPSLQAGKQSILACSTYLAGKNRRVSAKEDSLSRAKEFAEDWYLELRGKHRRGEIKEEKTFRQAADRFVQEYEIITEGQRSPSTIDSHSPSHPRVARPTEMGGKSGGNRASVSQSCFGYFGSALGAVSIRLIT